MPTRTALDTAEARGLDLVEVAPNAAPPVCRLLDYGKFRYEVTRKEREARKEQKSRGGAQQQREVRFKTRIGDHDLETKTRLVKRLLDEGSKVRVSVSFRAREITHPEFGMAVLRRVAEELVDDAEMEKTPRVRRPVPDDGSRAHRQEGPEAEGARECQSLRHTRERLAASTLRGPARSGA